MKPIIGIIGGKGKMGRLMASFFHDKGIKVRISDKNTKLTNKKLAETSDITIISVPLDKTRDVINKVLFHIKPHCAIMDLSSLKEMPIKEMLKGKCEVMGMHPMFGESNPVPGQRIIICETPRSGKWSKWMQKFLKENGVKLSKMSPSEHDKTMSIVQALIHFSDIAFMDCLRELDLPLKKILKYTSLASELKIELAGRLLNQDSNLYGNMQILNRNNPKVLRSYLKSIEKLFNIVQKKDLNAFIKYFDTNFKEFKSFNKEAYKESSILIDKMIENRRASHKDSSIKPKKTDLATLGPKNSFSELAAETYAPNTNKFFTQTIEEVFDLVKKGRVKEGICPIENSLHGTVRETIDSLFKNNVHICKKFSIPIHHCLIALPQTKAKDIKTVISHSQALNQCKKYLRKHFPKSERLQYSSTSAALERLINTNNRNLAVIANEQAASRLGLKCLSKNIEDNNKNSTEFIVIRKGKSIPQKTDTHASIAFHFDKDSPGTLAGIFKIFADAGVNLTKIESRPTKAIYGDYIFYLDFEGNPQESKIAKTLKMVESRVAKLKLLGSYSSFQS
ncbi:prephenate dehydratase [Candidatus Peregrinibacteria bacterium]|nr:prephenate dehydratase [Candidatus Peregrinibacteria bacterium]